MCIVHYWSCCLLKSRRIELLQKARYTHDTKKRIVAICTALRNFAKEKPIALLAFLSDLKDIFDNSGEYEGEAAQDVIMLWKSARCALLIELIRSCLSWKLSSGYRRPHATFLKQNGAPRRT